MGKFLNDLGGSLNSMLQEQLGLAEGKPGNLDGDLPGDFGKLGDFAARIDKSAQRSYIEDGVIRNIRPRALEIISQEPDMTVVIKKRLFASLKENYKADLLDDDELLFMRASKALFENKCRAIAAYERLTKFERVASKNDGMISDFAFPAVFGAIDSLGALVPGLVDGKTKATLDTIKRIKAFSDPNFFTTWIRDDGLPFDSPTGDGTGVFELTTVSNITASNSTEFGKGKATLSIEDPYRLMVVTNADIDRAITDAVNLFKQQNFFRVSEFQLERSITDLKARLSQIRLETGASQIKFQINEDTILYKKVTARIERTGREIGFKFDSGILGSNLFSFDGSDAVQLDPEATEGIEGLQGAEIDLFQQIIKNTYTLMGLKQTTRSEIKQFNKKTNPVRKKMRLHYANKPIIQPMDVVSIFISTKQIHDPFINQGLRANYAADSLLNAIDNAIGNVESAIDDIKNTFSGGTNGESFLENERNAIAGPDFPLWLWGILRNDFTRQAAGTCVFNGIVKSSSHSYSNGKYNLTINIDDNCHYFNKGQINIQPSLEVFNSAIYDPLTPFQLDFDESSGMLRGEVPPLLDANKRLLNTGSVKAKLGKYKGQPLDEPTFNRENVEQIARGFAAQRDFGRQFRRKFTNPDGFVYRWKEGIGSLVLFGEPYSNLTKLGSMRSERSPFITKDPFAAQDTMNVLSLLITGQPYNFNTFMEGSLKFGQLSRDDLFNDTISASFLRGLISDLTRQNSVWGNFIPFKKLVVNEREYVALAGGTFDLKTKNARLNKLLSDRAEAFDLAVQANSHLKNTPMFHKFGKGGEVIASSKVKTEGFITLTGIVAKLDEEIIEESDAFEESKAQAKAIQSGDGTLSIAGDDISFDPSLTKESGEVNETKRRIERAEFRSKINNLTLRRLWRVKANEDPNLFIVDDSYDKNYDIQSFERALGGKMETFKSNYATAFQQIESVRQILGLEVFADSQGHIRARPPQYNRMPSSVFRNMLQEKAQLGVKIFPDFLESLFFNQVQGITEQLEIVEDQIRLRAAALGNNDDAAVKKLIGGGFEFLTREDTGKFGSKDMRSLMDQNEPDQTEEIANKVLKPLAAEVNTRLNATINFDSVKRKQLANIESTFTATSSQDVIEKISNRIRKSTRNTRIPSSVQDITSNDRKGRGRSQVDILRILNQIAQFVAERQRLMKRLKPAITNLREGLAVNVTASVRNPPGGKALLLPNLNRKKDKAFPEILESMIEDENNHDLGTGSGARYILSDDKIISFTLNENEPPYNFVQVDGRLGQGIVALPQGLEVSAGGNAIATAWAVDYDLWRMYGFRASPPVTLPFFDDPNSQCAPYAVYLLNLSRKQVFTATCTVIGNEFIQAGEVYYIESYDLLLYAISVSHNFTYNGSYTTTLTLAFGRNPGEYIPTQLDIIGKGLYSNSHRSDLVRQVRHNRGDNTSHLTIVVRDTKEETLSGQFNNVKNLVQGRFKDQNRQNLSNMLLATTGLLTPSSFNDILNIELRIYFNKNSSINVPKSDDLEAVAESIKAWLVDPRKVNLENPEELLPDTRVETQIDASRVQVIPVDLDPDKKSDDEGGSAIIRSPSSQAWAMARNLIATGAFSSTNTANADDEDEEQETSADKEMAKLLVKVLTQSVVDIWITFTPPGKIVSETSKK